MFHDTALPVIIITSSWHPEYPAFQQKYPHASTKGIRNPHLQFVDKLMINTIIAGEKPDRNTPIITDGFCGRFFLQTTLPGVEQHETYVVALSNVSVATVGQLIALLQSPEATLAYLEALAHQKNFLIMSTPNKCQVGEAYVTLEELSDAIERYLQSLQ
ncbi:MAG: hypothetical protein H6774_03480 [Pseudomonadales bacterium]|nr:hypothetical protein [Candidatus Woesebacteria bacterium]MCB9802122.1 hypothetical protein [Pseudomonadales bacterium]